MQVIFVLNRNDKPEVLRLNFWSSKNDSHFTNALMFFEAFQTAKNAVAAILTDFGGTVVKEWVSDNPELKPYLSQVPNWRENSGK